jgi:hypothetical protein
VDVGKSFRFVFEDKDWITKVLIGGLVSLVPVVNLAATGYVVRALRNVGRREPRPLPDWREFGDFFLKGAGVLAASLVYFSPLVMLAILAAILGAVFAATQGRGLVVGGLGLLAFVAVIYGPLAALWFQAATAVYAAEGDFVAYFRLGEIWQFVGRDVGGYAVALLASLAAVIAAGAIGGIFFGIGATFAAFIAGLMSAHLYGQLLAEEGQPAQ